jgi:ubiquinone/menaquinone biosynthesis C-methylase UbiE
MSSHVTGEGSTTGLDFNATMIDEARSISESSGLDIRWIEGDALDLPFEENEFDTVFCQQGLQFFPDKPKAAGEMYRVLKPGGKAAISVWTSLEENPYGFAMVEALNNHISSDVADGLRSPFGFNASDSLRLTLESAGFSRVEIQEVEIPMSVSSPKEFVLRHLRVLPTAAEIFASSPEAIDNVATDVELSLQRFVQSDHFAVPWRAHVAIATK